jgi:7-cyano-7-deazaguanine synthase
MAMPKGGNCPSADEFVVARNAVSPSPSDERALATERPAVGGTRYVPATYVPARNLIFLSLALAWAEVLGASDIFIGANIVDYSGYPDCRPAFLRCFEKLARLATKAGAVGGRRFRIRAPLLRMSKAAIVATGAKLGVDFALTHSCYDPSPRGLACGLCDSCRLRLKGFAEAGIGDPAQYKTRPECPNPGHET